MDGLEIELKAGLDSRSAATLANRLKRRCGLPEVRALRAVYFDTPGRTLRSAGIALRVRREGRIWVQAAKWGQSGQGGFRQLHELECRLPGPTPDIGRFPDAALRQAIGTACAGAQLEQWFETRVQRRIWRVGHAIGLVEVAIDRGAIHAAGTTEPILEAEFELTAGSPEAVFALAADLVGDLPADLLLQGKAQRGILLAQGPRRAADLPQKPRPSEASRDGADSWASCLAALSAAVAFHLHRVLQADDSEGPHQLRVALRRLRAAEQMHRPLLDRQVAAEIASAARTIGQILAPLRDSDVMIETLCAAEKVTPALALALADAGAQVRSRVRDALCRAGATAFAIRLLQLSAIGGWRPVGRARNYVLGKLAADRLETRWRHVSKLGNRLSTLSDDERHILRKDIKKLRYLLEIQSNPDEKTFKSNLKKLQESLGVLNDIAVLTSWSAETLPERLVPVFEDVRQGLLASTQARADLALGRACRHWRTLRALPGPWGSTPAP